MATTVARQRPRAARRPRGLTRFAGGALAAALAALVYVNALDNPFVYDDRDTVVENPSLADLSNIRFILTHSPFRPVVNASYALDRAIWGDGPLGFHVTSVVLHACVVLLLHAFLRRALADARRGAGGDPADGWIACAGATLYGVHPLMTEAVGYISGRSELLCAAFVLAAMLRARRAMLSPAPGLIWASAAIFAVLGVLSKEVAVVIPVLIVAYDWLVLPGDTAARARRTWRLYVPAAALLGLLAAYRLSVVAGPVSTQSPLLNLWTQAIVVWRYLGLLFVPVGQAVMHGVHTATSAADPKGLLAAAGLVCLAVGALAVRRTLPLVSFGVVWFLAAIAPSSSVVALREGMAEHRTYLASAGIFMALAGIAASNRRLIGTRVPPGRYAAALAVICLVLAVLTVRRNAVWASPALLWREATVHAAGMWEPHYALADTLRESGDCASAVVEYARVVTMRPHHRDAHTNHGICLAGLGRLEEAEAAFRRALDIDPGFARGYTNLGALAIVAREPDRAREFYRRALEVDPRNVLARMQLARLYETVYRDFHAAVRMCGEARAIAPATPGVEQCMERNDRLAAEAARR